MVDQVAMRTRVIGERTATAIGCDVHLATSAARGVDAIEVERTLHEAIELGVTLVAAAGDDDQRLAGEVVRTRRARDRVIVVAPVPLLPERPGAPRDTLPERLPVGHVQERVEAALRATRLEVLPLVTLPVRVAWHSSRAWAELAGACERLVREGKVLAWGAAIDRVETEDAPVAEDPHAWARGESDPAPPVQQLAAPLRALLADFAAVSVPFNLCERGAELIDKPTVLAGRPLAGGALTGELGPGVKLRQTDDRRGIDLTRIAVGIARLAPFVKREPPAARSCDPARIALEANPRREAICETIAELALRYVLDHACAVVRLHRHVAESIAAAAAAPLPRDLLDALPRDI